LLAQTLGSASGSVTDPTHSFVPGVTVVAKQDATGETRTVVTNGNGSYTVPLLSPGAYTLTFSRSGFKEVQVHAQVVVTEVTPVNVTMAVGDVTSVVTVDDLDTVALETSSSTQGRVVGEKQVQDLPLSTRNFTQLMTLSPGVSGPVNDATQTGRGTQVIYDNGARSTSNGLTLDGIDAIDIHTGTLAPNTLGSNGVPIPSPDVVQEFKVQTGLYDAQYGRNAGTNTALITRQGGVRYRGSVYEYFRNTDLDANSYFTRVAGQRRPELNQNQFGLVLSGPVPLVRDTHLLASYQGTRQIDAVSGVITDTLPTALYGLTRTPASLAAALGTTYGGLTGRYGTQALAANGSNINPVALKLLLATLPNGNYVVPSPQSTATSQNYTTSVPSTYNEDGWLFTLDHSFGSKDTAVLRGLLVNDPQFNAFGEATVPGFGESQDFKSRGINLEETHVFSPRLVNEARVGFLRTTGYLTAQTDIPISSIGMSRFDSSTFDNVPRLTVTSYTPTKAPTPAQKVPEGGFEIGYTTDGNEGGAQNTFEETDTLAIVRGKHNIRTGGEIRHYQDNYYDWSYTLGTLGVYSFVDFLLGTPAGPIASGGNGSTSNGSLSSSAVGSTNALRNDRLTDYTAFVQDDWQVRHNLTLNLGFRWDRFGFAKDIGGRNGNFVPSLYTPPPSGGKTSAGFVQPANASPLLPGLPTVNSIFLNHNMWKNFEPRIGLAYQFAPKFVLHAGYGIYPDRISNQIGLRLALAPPNYFRSTLTASESSTLGLASPFSTSLPAFNQLPSIPYLYDPFTAPATTLFSGEAIDPNMSSPYLHQYTASMQWKASRDLLVEVGYVGTKGVKLPGQQLISEAQLASPTNPINGITTNTTANIDERVPFLGMTTAGLTYLYDNEDSRYNALQVSVTKSLRYGLQFLASYTRSRSVDDGSGSTGSVFNTISGDQDNVHQATGISDFDRPSRFVLSGLYDVPGLARHWINNALTRGVFDGWQLAYITTLQNGIPFTITDSNGASLYGSGTSRANYATGDSNANAKKSGNVISRLNNYFNQSAFVTAGPYYGNVNRNSLRGPGSVNTDFSVLKNVNMVKGTTFQFRAEMFNVFNQLNFGNPASAFSSSSSFGVISSQVGNPRIVQFSARVAF
jgi:hypothetical protein